MQLNRTSLEAWIEKTEKRVNAKKPTIAATTASDSLLQLEDVLLLLNISRSTLYRKIKAGEVEDAHLEHPKRWRKSYIDSLIGEEARN
ncbi:hypothetical protein [uncultured Deefgea sp.]|uniref:hypothetical protein n=1 Tax=uncultured Deefgea sp. TaxID=1304914 RepID=UPI0025984EC7|nr:hypothetical protein [uncultured Deefgea sp.]